MNLKFPSKWRLHSSKSSTLNTETIPESAIEDFMGGIRRTAMQGNVKFYYEHYKKYFSLANGQPHYKSSRSLSDLKPHLSD